MKKFMLALFIGFVAATGAFGEEENQSMANADVLDQHHSVWHCTAYPEGHGHHHGYSARDLYKGRARHRAMMRCERSTGLHCHHIDCHVDHNGVH